MRTSLLAAAAILAFCAAGAASAKAPEPHKSLDLDRFMGRWYEILRTPNDAQKNCYVANQVWSQVSPGRFSISQNCRRGSPDGPERRVQTAARTLDPPTNAKFEASFFGGLLRKQYWVLDRADDYGWMIASTSAGDYVSVLARKPGLPRAEVEALTARVAAMGLDAGRLVPVGAAVD